MRRLNLTALLRKATTALEDSLRHYEQPVKGNAREFVDLKLQACIFHYDACAEMVGFMRNKPTGFAAAVALKGLVLRLYEYDSLINSSFIPRLLSLAKARGVPIGRDTVKHIRDPWKAELKRLKGWSEIRNHAAGHYGKDFAAQVTQLKNLDPNEVMTVTFAFLSFNFSLLRALKEVGHGVAHDA